MCACSLYAAFFFLFISILAALFISEAGHHGNSMCAGSVQWDTPLVFPLLLTQRHLRLWAPTGPKRQMQMVPAERPKMIHPRFVT